MKRTISLILVSVLCAFFAGCTSTHKQAEPAPAAENATEYGVEAQAESRDAADTPEPADSFDEVFKVEREEEEYVNKEKTLHLLINDTEVRVNWEENEAVAALAELVSSAPLTVQMSMYGGFEQVGSLGTDLPRSDSQTTTQAGDIVLYSGNQIVVFYGSNSWSYTRLGRITDKSASELAELLGNGDATVTMTME